MVVLKLTSLVLAATVGAAPAATARTSYAPSVVVDSEAVLTVDVLTKLTAFWTEFKKEPLAIRDTARHKLRRQVPIDLRGVGKFTDDLPLDAENMEAIAAQYPAVAEDFKKVGLTPSQWEMFRRAVWTAELITHAPAEQTIDPQSVRGQNIAFLRAHPKELAALKAAGMPFYGWPGGGGD